MIQTLAQTSAIRSWLFVPADSEEKLFKAASCGADAVVVDLGDSVAASEKPRARIMARDWLEAHRRQVVAGGNAQRWVRINGIDGGIWRDDLAMVMPSCPDGIVVTKAMGQDQLQMLAGELYELEQHHGIPTGTTRLLPLVSESPAAALGIAKYADAPLTRLAALSWGAEGLATSIGASRKRDEAGHWTDVFRMVRAQILLAAHARGVVPVDTIYANFRDLDGLARTAAESAADGFGGMLAIHPDQVPIINTAFRSSQQSIEDARVVVDAFSANPSSGVLQIDGMAVDQTHLEQAVSLLERLH